MHARQTTVRADPANIDSALAQVRDSVLPALREAEGFKGLTVLVDREGGTLVGTSFFETEENVRASEQAVSGPRQDAARAAGANEPEVVFFEVALDMET